MSSCGGKKMEKGGKVITPQKEKERIRKMEKEARMKKILTEDMKMFGLKEESKPVGKKEGGMLNKGRTITPEMRKRLEPMYRENFDKYRPKRYKSLDQMTDEEKKALTKPMGKKKGGKVKKYGVGGAVAKGVKKLVSKMKGEKANPYKSTVGDSYATRSKKQGEIEQSILKDNSIYKTKKDKDAALKTLSDRMKRERKETLKQKMGFKKGGKVYCKDGCAIKGKTKGRMV